MIRFPNFILLLLFAIVPLAKAHKQDDPFLAAGIQAEASLGFNGGGFVHLPTPVLIQLGNDSGEDLMPTLEIEYYSNPYSKQPEETQRFELSLPNHSRKSYRFCVSMKDGRYNTLQFRLRDKRRLLWSYQAGLSFADFNSTDIRVLVVDPQRNRLNLPPLPTKYWDGKSVEMVVIKGDELPVADAPLTAFQAIILTPDLQHRAITIEQCAALARYVAAGGMLMVWEGQISVLNRVREQAPFAFNRPGIEQGALEVQPAGAGHLVAYRGKPGVSGAENSTLPEQMLACLLQSPGTGFMDYAQFLSGAGADSPERLKSILMVLGLFALYTILSGPVIMTLHKAKRRTRVIYLAVVVSSFCVLVMFLGPLLGRIKGPARWLTVTELTPDGAIQQAMVEVISAGGRQHELVFAGDRTECWLFTRGGDSSDRYWFSHGRVPARDFQMLEAIRPGARPLNRILVPVMPWGSRNLMARDFTADSGIVEISCAIRMPEDTERTLLRGSPYEEFFHYPGEVVLKFTNHSPYPLSNGRFILSTGLGTDRFFPSQEFILPLILPGESADIRTSLRLAVSYHSHLYNNVQLDYYLVGNARLRLPMLRLGDSFSGVFLAQIPESPKIEIAPGGFTASRGEHFILYRVPAEQMPLKKDFIASAEEAAAEIERMKNSANPNP